MNIILPVSSVMAKHVSMQCLATFVMHGFGALGSLLEGETAAICRKDCKVTSSFPFVGFSNSNVGVADAGEFLVPHVVLLKPLKKRFATIFRNFLSTKTYLFFLYSQRREYLLSKFIWYAFKE